MASCSVPERVFTLGVAVDVQPVGRGALPAPGAHPTQRLAAIGLVLLAVTSNTTAIGRIARLLAALRQGMPAPRRSRRRRPTSRGLRPRARGWSEPDPDADDLLGARSCGPVLKAVTAAPTETSSQIGANTPRPLAPQTFTDFTSSGSFRRNRSVVDDCGATVCRRSSAGSRAASGLPQRAD